jgi:predicted ATPase
VEAAKAHEDAFADGAFFCPLAPLQSVDAIVPTVAQALGFSFYGGANVVPRQQLFNYLRNKTMLLVMDNFEHLLALQGGGVDLVTDLLKAAPGAKVVVTSRARLNVQEEHLFPVPGMSFSEEPDGLGAARAPSDIALSARLTQHSAITLFLYSVRRVRPELEPTDADLRSIARICRQVQGVPLAILLAAAWIEILTPAEIAAEIERGLLETETSLRDLPARQRSMRAVYDHSWRLLSQDERTVFAALSVFRGGFTREAAQEVSGASLRGLMALVNKSLLHRAPSGRYEVHELLRQFAAERLARDPEASEAAHDRHCGYYVEGLRQREGEIMDGKQRAALLEMDNVRAAWRWAVQRGKVAEIRASCIPLSWICIVQGWYDEIDALFGSAVDVLRKDEPVGEKGVTLGLALVFQAGGWILRGHYHRAVELVREGLSILQKLGARRELVWGLFGAVVVGAVTDPSEIEQFLRQSLTIATELGNQRERAFVLNTLGAVVNARGATQEAEAYVREALRINKSLQSSRGMQMCFSTLGDMAYSRAKYAEARRLYQESLTHARTIGSRTDVAFALGFLGDVALAMAEPEKARENYQASLAMLQEMGLRWTYAYWYRRLGDVALAVGDDQGATCCHRQALEAALDSQDEETALDVLSKQAAWLAQDRDREGALKLAVLVLSHPKSPEPVKGATKRLLGELSAQLPPGIVAATQKRGRQRDLWATVADLLVELGDQQRPDPQ